MIIVSGFYYTQPGPDAFFWAGEDSPGCNEDSIEHNSYPMAPGQVGSMETYGRVHTSILIIISKVPITTARTSPFCLCMMVSRATS